MGSRKPRKPTQPFGHVAFGPTGEVTRHIVTLSEHKEDQEREAAEIFVQLFNESYQLQKIENLHQLPEDGHDFEAQFPDGRVQIQLTELVDRSYTTVLPVNEAAQAKLSKLKPGAQLTPTRLINRRRETMALWSVIHGKLAKSYSRPATGALWLVVFTTTVYATEYIENGRRKVSDGLQFARINLALQGASPFDQIWFTDLELRPIRVWPPADNAA